MTSPVGSDYAAYLAEALRQELALAGKLDPERRPGSTPPAPGGGERDGGGRGGGAGA